MPASKLKNTVRNDQLRLDKLVNVFVLAMMVLGCTPTKKTADQMKGQNVVADFLVSSATGEVTSSKLIKELSWQSKKAKTYSYKACLKTKSNNKSIRGVKFTVMGAKDSLGEENPIVAITSPEGCLEWQDQIEYSQFVEGSDLTREYRVYAQGENNIYKGMVPVRFIVNPWDKATATYWRSGTTPSVPMVQLIADPKISALRLSGEDKEAAYPLVMNLMEFRDSVPDETSPGGFRVQMDMRFKPGVQVLDPSGEKTVRDIKSGRFKLRAQLIATEVDGVKSGFIILPKEPVVVRSVGDDGTLRFRVDAEISRQAYRGRLKLAVKIEPFGSDAPKALDSYEGLYLIGRANDRPYKKPHAVQDSIGRSYEEGAVFSFDEYIESQSNFNDLKDKMMAFDIEPFFFHPALGTYEQVQPGETATQRTVEFRVRTCVEDAAFGKPVRERQFKVTRVSESGKKTPILPEDARTDVAGCFAWSGAVSHGVYKKERIIPVHYDVEYDYSAYAKKDESGNTVVPEPFKKRITVFINPWDDKFTFARDAQEISKEQELKAVAPKIQSRLFLSSYKYETLKFGYELDTNLNLKVKKTILLTLDPWVLRYNSNVSGRAKMTPLRDGIYLLKVAYQKDYLDPATKGIHILRTNDVYARRKAMALAGEANMVEGAQQITQDELVDLKSEIAEGSYVQSGKKPKDENGNGIVEAQERFIDLADDRRKRIRKQYISSVSKLVRVNKGRIITPIEIELRDLRLLRVRSQFLFQLQPVDERLLVVANNINNEYTKEMVAEIEGRFRSLLDKARAEGGDEQVQRVMNTLVAKGEALRALEKDYDTLSKDRKALNTHMYEFYDEDAKLKLEELAVRRQADLEGVLDLISGDAFKRRWYEENRADSSGEDRLESVSQAARKLNFEKDEAFQTARREFMEQSRDGVLLSKAISEFDIRPEILDKIESAYITNDFTVMSTAPLVKDLDVFVEPYEISGLDRRTFIGPVTFLRNANNGRIRPTDNLDEINGMEPTSDALKAAGITAREIVGDLELGSGKISDQRNAKFYQSVAHFSEKHVDDLIEEQRRLDEEFKIEQRAFSKLHNYVNLYDYEFISLANNGETPETLERVLPQRCSTIYRPDFFESCYEEDLTSVVELSKFVSGFNRYSKTSLQTGLFGEARAEIDAEAIQSIVDTGVMPKNLMYSMCYLFIDKTKVRRGKGKLLKNCIQSINSKDKPFLVEQKVRVEKIGKKVFKGGKQMNVNVGTGISLNRDEKMSFGTGAAGFKFIGDVLKPIAPIVGSSTGFLRLSYDYGRGKSASVGTSISKQTFLVMQTAAFDIRFEEYRKCAAIRWNPKMFVPALHNISGNRGKNFDVPGGYFICNAEVETEKPMDVREHYYYFTQHFTDGDLLDPGDLYNHPWLLALRGVGDAARFLSLLEKNNYVLYRLWGSEQFECDSGKSGKRGLDISGQQRHLNQEFLCKNYHQWPIQKMINVYLKTTPTIPGIYTVMNDDADYPFSETPTESIDAYKNDPLTEEPIGSQRQDYVLGLPDFSGSSTLTVDDFEEAVRKNNEGIPLPEVDSSIREMLKGNDAGETFEEDK